MSETQIYLSTKSSQDFQDAEKIQSAQDTENPQNVQYSCVTLDTLVAAHNLGIHDTQDVHPAEYRQHTENTAFKQYAIETSERQDFRPFPSKIPVKMAEYNTITDRRGFIPVYEYLIRNRNIMWDRETGYVYLTGILRCIKADINTIYKLRYFPQLYTRFLRGTKLQGTWCPYDLARFFSLRVAWEIREELIPLFGPEFPNEVLQPTHPKFGILLDYDIYQENITFLTRKPPFEFGRGDDQVPPPAKVKPWLVSISVTNKVCPKQMTSKKANTATKAEATANVRGSKQQYTYESLTSSFSLTRGSSLLHNNSANPNSASTLDDPFDSSSDDSLTQLSDSSYENRPPPHNRRDTHAHSDVQGVLTRKRMRERETSTGLSTKKYKGTTKIQSIEAMENGHWSRPISSSVKRYHCTPSCMSTPNNVETDQQIYLDMISDHVLRNLLEHRQYWEPEDQVSPVSRQSMSRLFSCLFLTLLYIIIKDAS